MAGVMCNGGFVPYGGFCVTCPVGTHSIDDVCTFCEKGQYQSDAGQTSCIPCPSGQTTNTIGSTDSTQCIENRTTQPDPGKIPGGGEDTINVMMLASVVSVLALVVAIAAVCVVCYKKISSKSSVAGPSINLRPSTARTRFIRNGRRTPVVPPISECHRSDTIRIYDDIRSSESYYARILSYDSMYLTPGSTCMRCSDPPPPYDLVPAQYTDKEYNDVDNTYAVIDDNISTAEKI
ncbi:uncharacterized protein LOC132759186 [Ruditapes philippinarum]|uniref:uncharacterized protein LOC132759186 n=1 Tax=Ruditapes philippinarum TaxID=129788 RepID=UPI00295AEF74|nr:uncharacterized protein LOC132759186 [Ruditapes philippinarum]